ncbi:Tuberous sclerosis 2-like protein [Cladochytrium tenue]|nr:Tuberous sclerosis 2-like protein [Cladochytrium tenue]
MAAACDRAWSVLESRPWIEGSDIAALWAACSAALRDDGGEDIGQTGTSRLPPPPRLIDAAELASAALDFVCHCATSCRSLDTSDCLFLLCVMQDAVDPALTGPGAIFTRAVEALRLVAAGRHGNLKREHPGVEDRAPSALDLDGIESTLIPLAVSWLVRVTAAGLAPTDELSTAYLALLPFLASVLRAAVAPPGASALRDLLAGVARAISIAGDDGGVCEAALRVLSAGLFRTELEDDIEQPAARQRNDVSGLGVGAVGVLLADVNLLGWSVEVLAFAASVTRHQLTHATVLSIAESLLGSYRAGRAVRHLCDLVRRGSAAEGPAYHSAVRSGAMLLLAQCAWNSGTANVVFPMTNAELLELALQVAVEDGASSERIESFRGVVLLVTKKGSVLSLRDWDLVMAFAKAGLNLWRERDSFFDPSRQWSAPEDVDLPNMQHLRNWHKALLLAVYSSLSALSGSFCIDEFYDCLLEIGQFIPNLLAQSLLQHLDGRLRYNNNAESAPVEKLVQNLCLERIGDPLVAPVVKLLTNMALSGEKVDRDMIGAISSYSSSVPKFALNTAVDARSIAWDTESLTIVFKELEVAGIQVAFSSSTAAFGMSLDFGGFVELWPVVLQEESDWNTYIFVLQKLASQLQNRQILLNAPGGLQSLRSYLCTTILNEKAAASVEYFPETARKSDAYLLLFHLLSAVVPYKHLFSRQEIAEIISCFETGLQKWQTTPRFALHTLSVCLFEFPHHMNRFVPNVILTLSRMTSSSVAPYILEFLASLGRFPDLYVNCSKTDFERVFGIALRAVQSSTGHTTASAVSKYVIRLAFYVITAWFVNLKIPDRRNYVPFITRSMGLSTSEPNGLVNENVELVYDVLVLNTFVDCSPRPANVSGFGDGKSWVAPDGTATGRSWVVGSAVVTVRNAEASRPGMAEVTVRRPSGVISFETNLDNGAIRRPSFAISPPSISEVPGLVVSANADEKPLRRVRSISESSGVAERDGRLVVLRLGVGSDLERSQSESSSSPSNDILDNATVQMSENGVDSSFFFLQMLPMLPRDEMNPPILLGNDNQTLLALKTLDRTPVIDLHKIGIVYIGPGQSDEVDILANVGGSLLYSQFVTSLGKVISLAGAKKYTGGLVPDQDGQHCIIWEDFPSGMQMVFHTTTMMPTRLETDPRCSMKKSHIGNDLVVIAFDESGFTPPRPNENGDGAPGRTDDSTDQPRHFGFHTFPGDFNFVNIVVTPLPAASDAAPSRNPGDVAAAESPSVYADTWFRVRMTVRNDVGLAGYVGAFGDPPWSGRLVSGRALADTVRAVALHANMLALVSARAREGGGMFERTALARLRQIRALRDRAARRGGDGQAAVGAGGPGGPGDGGGGGSGGSGRARAASMGSGGARRPSLAVLTNPTELVAAVWRDFTSFT